MPWEILWKSQAMKIACMSRLPERGSAHPRTLSKRKISRTRAHRSGRSLKNLTCHRCRCERLEGGPPETDADSCQLVRKSLSYVPPASLFQSVLRYVIRLNATNFLPS